MKARSRLVAAVLAQHPPGARGGYLLLSTGAVSMDGGANVPLSVRDLLIDLILEHLPEIYNRTRSIWPRRG